MHAAKELVYSVVGIAIIGTLLFTSIMIDPNGSLIFVELGVLFFAWLRYLHLLDRGKEFTKGKSIFVVSLIFVRYTFYAAALTYFFVLRSGGSDENALAAVLVLGILLLVVLGFLSWLFEGAKGARPVEHQRGRNRYDQVPQHLLLPAQDQMPESQEPADSKQKLPTAKDLRSFADWTSQWEHIPEDEFDPDYQFDISDPFKSPLKPDSKYRGGHHG